jgi:hypothetical protein
MTEAQERRAIEKAAELVVHYMKTHPTFDQYECDSPESYKEAKEFFDHFLHDKVRRLYPEYQKKFVATLDPHPYL